MLGLLSLFRYVLNYFCIHLPCMLKLRDIFMCRKPTSSFCDTAGCFSLYGSHAILLTRFNLNLWNYVLAFMKLESASYHTNASRRSNLICQLAAWTGSINCVKTLGRIRILKPFLLIIPVVSRMVHMPLHLQTVHCLALYPKQEVFPHWACTW